jgi:membrane complex biogenesis BtpA family protein
MGFFSADFCAFVGMVHLGPLPGSAGWAGDLQAIEDAALQDARALLQGGCHAILVENMGDTPYLNGAVLPETVAAMTRITREVTRLGLPTGVQILAGANRQALAVAYAAGAQFLRVEGFAYAHVADEGWIEACAGPLLRARANLGAQHIAIWTDVQKKHSAHAVTSDLSVEELAHGHAFCGADTLVITGDRTGGRTRANDVRAAAAAGLPVVVGSGVDLQDAAGLAKIADALIVGSALKVDGQWSNPVDPVRVGAISQAVRR